MIRIICLFRFDLNISAYIISVLNKYIDMHNKITLILNVYYNVIFIDPVWLGVADCMSKDEYYVIVALFLFMCYCFILFMGQDELVIFCQG